jgi:rare lipoprotein A
MGEDLVRLSASAARELGAPPTAPLLVRVRFVEPAIAYRQRAPLTYALARPQKPQTQLAAAPGPGPKANPHAAPIMTARQEGLPTPRVTSPIAPAAAPSRQAASTRPPVVGPSSTSDTGAKTLRVQAGAFANPGNARRAVSMLASAGHARIQPVQRADGVTLYRVVMDCQGGAQAAEALRIKVVGIGFADARVVGGS